MILSPDDPVVQRWAAERERRRKRREARRQEAQRRAAVKPTRGVYAATTRVPSGYWRDVIRQSAARRLRDKQLLASKAIL